MRNKQSTPFVNIGSSSLLVVFLVLCLVMFAALSLASAGSDFGYSSRMAQRRTEYYAACAEAEQLLDEIDARLEQAKLTNKRADLKDLGLEQKNDTLSFDTVINDREALHVALTLTPDGPAYYKITAWQTVTTAEWTENEPLNLMKIGDG